MSFLLEIATPERLLVREQVAEAQIPCAEGYIGVLPQHAPLLSELGIGELSYQLGGQRHSLIVGGGWVEVLGTQTRVLASSAERVDEIDLARAELALKRAKDRLHASPGGVDIGRALNALKRAQARLDAKKG